jgi:hypothetical protein
VFDLNTVLGRDTASVFPVESRKVDPETLESMLGATYTNRFVSEKELDEIKGKRKGGAGGGEDDLAGSVPAKPLAEILRDQKEAKQRDFEDKLKLIKQGAF